MSSDPMISGMHTIFVENNSIEHNDRTIFGAKFSCPSAQNVCKIYLWLVCMSLPSTDKEMFGGGDSCLEVLNGHSEYSGLWLHKPLCHCMYTHSLCGHMGINWVSSPWLTVVTIYTLLQPWTLPPLHES